jgi:hypothetical protein
MIFYQLSLCSQKSEKLTARDVIHQEIEVSVILRETLQTDLNRVKKNCKSADADKLHTRNG